jgi:hypothetical protein
MPTLLRLFGTPPRLSMVPYSLVKAKKRIFEIFAFRTKSSTKTSKRSPTFGGICIFFILITAIKGSFMFSLTMKKAGSEHLLTDLKVTIFSRYHQ